MRGSDERETPLQGRSADTPVVSESGGMRFPGRWDGGAGPARGDLEGDTADDLLKRVPAEPADPTLPPLRFPSATPATVTDAWLRGHTRHLVREFLGAVPRSESEAAIALVRRDGTTRLFTRAELSAAIDRLRPRMRQIVRLSVEERWPRQRVCDYLNNISIKTYERDYTEAFDNLMYFIEEDEHVR